MEDQLTKYEGIIPPELVDSIKKKKCILFIGSGLSSQITRSNGKRLPLWGELLRELLDWTKEQQIILWGNSEDIGDMINKGNYLMAAQELQERIGINKLSEFLTEVFRDSSVCPGVAHRILPKIPFRAVLTTNYDTLVEGAYALENCGIIPTVLTQQDLNERHSVLRKEDFFIFKMHGHIDRLSTIVLGSRDYQDIIYSLPMYRQFMETIFSIYTVLFIGFSGNDPDLNNVIDRLSSLYSRTLDKHYILLPSGKMNSVEKRRLLSDQRLSVIEYQVDDNHTQVIEFLKELNFQVNKTYNNGEVINEDTETRIFISGSYEDAEIIQKISYFLNEKGYLTWDLQTIPNQGFSVSEKISRAIQKSYCYVIICSKNTNKSKWVSYELNYVLSKQIDEKVLVLPIVIDDYAYLPHYLQQIQALKLSTNFDANELQPLIPAIDRYKNMNHHCFFNNSK